MISPVTRLSHVALRSPDVERLRSYYTEVVGLTPYDEVDGVVFLASGGYGPALELRPSDDGGARSRRLRGQRRRTRTSCSPVWRDRASRLVPATTPSPASAASTRSRTSRATGCSFASSTNRRAAAGRASAGIVPNKIGHIAARTRSAAAVTEFYESALGFRWSDWMGDFFVFLRCNTDHHTVNFVNASRPGELHHFAFELGDRAELLSACDTLVVARRPSDLGSWAPRRRAQHVHLPR